MITLAEKLLQDKIELISWYFKSELEKSLEKPRYAPIELIEYTDELDNLCNKICKSTGAKLHQYTGGITLPK